MQRIKRLIIRDSSVIYFFSIHSSDGKTSANYPGHSGIGKRKMEDISCGQVSNARRVCFPFINAFFLASSSAASREL